MTVGEAWNDNGGAAGNDKGRKLSFWGTAFFLSVILRGGFPHSVILGGGFPHSVILRSFAPKNLWDAALGGRKDSSLRSE